MPAKIRLVILFVALTTAAGASTTHRSEIRIRDPFVLPHPASQTYYIYGTTTSGIFDGGVER
ncbi:MAG TPA: glycoside hydrolase, partial [Opitutaceae bacterium]|nr:glycoside hydrolase [Opitutaceae bacterium]